MTFLSPGALTKENQLASLHLRRDLALPTILKTVASSANDEGYAEGIVTNTRFGSFPHTTLLDLPWGAQVRASQVDTGTRGRKEQPVGKKRKVQAALDADPDDTGENFCGAKEAVAASSGFIHVLPPTPENWTTSLPHRTQVVYTPDYSYILHRIQARPGTVLLEAGSGSGSFTHAAARAVFNGYSRDLPFLSNNSLNGETKRHKFGKVYTFEYHAERHEKVAEEMRQHGLATIVQAAHRDVYNDGFLSLSTVGNTKQSPLATAVFLDLPAPWQALSHLNRLNTSEQPSALDPAETVHICTFSPCIEQAQKTISALRRHGWMDIEMVEMQHKRIEVRREYTGLQFEGMRGVNAMAADVDEALSKLREVEKRAREFHSGQKPDEENNPSRKSIPPGKSQEAQKTLFKDGRLIHRTEPELKTHTSYLVFAVLPREWTDEDEIQAIAEWPNNVSVPSNAPKSQRQLKREARQNRSAKRSDQEGLVVSLDPVDSISQ